MRKIGRVPQGFVYGASGSHSEIFFLKCGHVIYQNKQNFMENKLNIGTFGHKRKEKKLEHFLWITKLIYETLIWNAKIEKSARYFNRNFIWRHINKINNRISKKKFFYEWINSQLDDDEGNTNKKQITSDNLFKVEKIYKYLCNFWKNDENYICDGSGKKSLSK